MSLHSVRIITSGVNCNLVSSTKKLSKFLLILLMFWVIMVRLLRLKLSFVLHSSGSVTKKLLFIEVLSISSIKFLTVESKIIRVEL